ncbi:MAG: ABC transporter permease [Candidatus Diapherotrites archaeon]|nr:ABC transporter permease [Candidatus Diapherotrites archaeon]
MIKLAFLNLFRRKTRTALALLAIIIGVAAITVMVSIVDGLYAEFNDVVSQYQGIQVFEKGAVDQTLSVLDASFARDLEKIPNVKSAIPEIWYVPKEIDGKKNDLFDAFNAKSVYGLDVAKFYAASNTGWIFSIERGTLLSPNDDSSVLIGNKVADEYGKFVGSTMEIDGKKFRVKGIFSGSSDLIENVIAMDLSGAEPLAELGEGKVSTFTLALKDSSLVEQTVDLVEFRYPNDLQAFSSSTYAEQFNSVLGNFRLLVFFIAAISSIVAGVVILNTVLMNILERQQEIGTLKAVGWTRSNIVTLVLVESAFIGFFGGILGLLFGLFVDILLSSFFGLNYAITLPLVLQAFFFALFVGIAAGVYPAFRAASLDPVEALRG